jgi:hypothetical protein
MPSRRNLQNSRRSAKHRVWGVTTMAVILPGLRRCARVCDSFNSRLHIFDATVSPPKQGASIALREQPGWITFSRDGTFAYPSTGEIIDAKSRKIVATLSDEESRAVHSEKVMEIDLIDGRPLGTGDQFGFGRVL